MAPQDPPQEPDPWRTIIHEPLPPGTLSFQRAKARENRWLFGLDYPQDNPQDKDDPPITYHTGGAMTLKKHTLLVAEGRALVVALGQQKLSSIGAHTVSVLERMADAIEELDGTAADAEEKTWQEEAEMRGTQMRAPLGGTVQPATEVKA